MRRPRPVTSGDGALAGSARSIVAGERLRVIVYSSAVLVRPRPSLACGVILERKLTSPEYTMFDPLAAPANVRAPDTEMFSPPSDEYPVGNNTDRVFISAVYKQNQTTTRGDGFDARSMSCSRHFT